MPEQFSKPKGGEGEAGEGAILPWSKGEGPTQGMACTVVDAGEGEELCLITPSAKKWLAVASLLITCMQQLRLCICKAGTGTQRSRAWASAPPAC